MGYYVNHPAMPKELFLNMEGLELDYQPTWPPCDPSLALVCLVDNGPFTAALVVYGKGEFEEANRPSDPRPKRWFLLNRADAIKFSGIKADYFEY